MCAAVWGVCVCVHMYVCEVFAPVMECDKKRYRGRKQRREILSVYVYLYVGEIDIGKSKTET